MRLHILTSTVFSIIISLFLLENTLQACSMYKITVDGKTMVGCNHDTWFTTPKIWFENATQATKYGAAFTGAREVAHNRTAPQSGMNEMGLAFSRLVAYYPKKDNPFKDRIQITDEVEYLTSILHTCSTVQEVKKYIEQYDHSIFFDDVFIYIDSKGNYLIVEPYQCIEGDEANYVLSNFCPSITDNQTARKQERYRNGEDFIKKHQPTTSLAYYKALSDTMHVCRNRNGDGTLLTSIWDTDNKSINLYFYHSYDSSVRFDLKEELAKGDRVINIPDLFEKNLEFERLINYKTPFNTPILRILLVVLGGVLTFFAFIFGVTVIINKNGEIAYKIILPMVGLNFILSFYLFVLATHSYIYYFDAPYKDHSSTLISISSYIPFVLLFLVSHFTVFTVHRLRSTKIKFWFKTVLVLNNLIYFVLLAAFFYWGLYDVI